MSSGTNQERIEQNNLKLTQLKTKADSLPEYQDIEPIYSVGSYNMIPVEPLGSSYNAIYNVLTYKDYLICNWVYSGGYNTSSLHLYKLEDNQYKHIKDLKISGANLSGSDSRCAIIKADDNYIYLIKGNGNNNSGGRIYELNLQTYDIQQKHNYIGSEYFHDFFSLANGYAVSNRISGGYLFRYTNTYTELRYVSNTELVYNKDKFVMGDTGNTLNRVIFNGDTPTVITKSYDTTTYGKIYGVNYTCTKLFTAKGTYELLADLSIGEKLSDNHPPYFVGCLNDKYYIRYNMYENYRCNAILYTFDEDTNTFEQVETWGNTTNRGCYHSEPCLYNQYSVGSFEYTSSKIGYKVYGDDLYFNSFNGASSSKVLTGFQVKDESGEVLIGTMPNNGALNYTPTTSQQTIPAGYTSGGTIEAVSMSEEDIQEAEEQIANLFGEGE